MAIRINRLPAGFVFRAQPVLRSKPPSGADRCQAHAPGRDRPGGHAHATLDGSAQVRDDLLRARAGQPQVLPAARAVAEPDRVPYSGDGACTTVRSGERPLTVSTPGPVAATRLIAIDSSPM